MKKVEVITKTTTEVSLGGITVDNYLRQIANLCNDGIDVARSKDAEYETLYDAKEFKKACGVLETQIEYLEGALRQILDYLGE